MLKRIPFTFILLIFLGGLVFATQAISASGADTLDLNGYLQQVGKSHEGLIGAGETSQGAIERAREAGILFSPVLYSQAQVTVDERPMVSPRFQGQKTTLGSASVGITQQTRLGLQADLSYNVKKIKLDGIDSEFVPQSDTYNNNASLELSQPLWKNGFGRTVRAQERAIAAQAKATSYGASFKEKQILAEAEEVFWTLALLRQSAVVQRESLKRSVELRNFNEDRVHKDLADKTDLLQSEATVRVKELDLQSLEDNIRTLSRTFNSYRGLDSDIVSENLPLLPPESVKNAPVPTKAEKRDDVLSAEETMKATVANADIARENQLPELELYGQLSLYGKDEAFDPAKDDSFSFENPVRTGGLRFNVPLDFSGTKKVRHGYAKEIKGATLDYQRKFFDQENQWADLVKSLDEAKARLEATVSLENVQKSKFEHEKVMLRRGRSTTYQVTQFEQDYLSSQIKRINSQLDVLQIIAQMKLFGGEK